MGGAVTGGWGRQVKMSLDPVIHPWGALGLLFPKTLWIVGEMNPSDSCLQSKKINLYRVQKGFHQKMSPWRL